MKNVTITALGFVSSLAALACGTPAAGTQPHAMSAADHDAAANKEQQAGKAHERQYAPEASATKKTCSPARGGQAVCWTSETNPTADHGKDAEQYREVAAQHRGASDTLRTAETSACSGVPQEDRDMSPFAHVEDIRSVSPFREEVKVGKSVSQRIAGAEVVFRAVPGMTAEWLQRVVDCHLARNAAIGHSAAGSEMAHCPLTPRGAQSQVRSVGDGFAVTIRADDAEASKEILRRAESLRPRPIAAN